MSFFAVLAIALALAMDAFAVSVSASATLPVVTWGHYFRLSFHFGLFQFLMPVVGWFLGVSVHSYIEAWDHWIAFALLSLVGVNMLREARAGEEEQHTGGDPSRGLQLVMLAVATSVDALAVGLSFAMINLSVLWPAAVIGLVCAAVTAAGVKLGRILGASSILGNKASILGGLVLIGIGIKILHEHGAL
ncbi:manganese efflux pump MntP family protein [Mailhella massiliensis]|uniref:Putative manganese efflux pump MntP n=1 Tax=Mailhella massiliensis TaxID=1903261 RepID=A0A921AUQ4_9BACT|nr:manganese efflux pump MntP family protein [Mailhella massiliensis]HJD96488.1 manganese efflux pump MntP family protein [Mailhella massiliensis]